MTSTASHKFFPSNGLDDPTLDWGIFHAFGSMPYPVNTGDRGALESGQVIELRLEEANSQPPTNAGAGSQSQSPQDAGAPAESQQSTASSAGAQG